MTTTKHFHFNEGLPTKPDVDLLLATWPAPDVGDRFEYAAIEKLIGAEWRDSRFRTVTAAWRHRLLERGIVVEAMSGEAFYVASGDQVSSSTYGALKFIGKKARKQRRKLVVAKYETDGQRAIGEHQARLMLAVEKDAKKHRMNLLPSTAATPPVIAIPDKARQV